MAIKRRETLALFGAGGAAARLPVQGLTRQLSSVRRAGNPLLKGMGVCDPQIRIFNGEAFMYSPHDASRAMPHFTMNDWRIWRSRDLVDWELAGVLRPQQTYFGKPSIECWATDAISRNGRYYPLRFDGA